MQHQFGQGLLRHLLRVGEFDKVRDVFDAQDLLKSFRPDLGPKGEVRIQFNKLGVRTPRHWWSNHEHLPVVQLKV